MLGHLRDRIELLQRAGDPDDWQLHDVRAVRELFRQRDALLAACEAGRDELQDLLLMNYQTPSDRNPHLSNKAFRQMSEVIATTREAKP
jgi:hypothetical protein